MQNNQRNYNQELINSTRLRSEPGDQYIMPVLIAVTLIVIVMIADGLSGWRLHDLLADLVMMVRN